VFEIEDVKPFFIGEFVTSDTHLIISACHHFPRSVICIPMDDAFNATIDSVLINYHKICELNLKSGHIDS